MRKQNLAIIIVLSVIYGSSAFAKPTSICKTDFDNLTCIRKASNSVNYEMSKTIDNLLKSVDNVNRLKESQIKWKQYKKSYCNDFMGEEAAYSQGDGVELIVESCLLNIDKNRLIELKSLNKVYIN